MNDLNILKENEAKLVSAELFYDDKHTPHKEHYLRLEYRCETRGAVYRVIYPHVALRVHTDRLPDYSKETRNFRGGTRSYVSAGFGEVAVPLDTAAVIVEEIEKKCYKMTLAEVEEKLGYKVELISEKEDKEK